MAFMARRTRRSMGTRLFILLVFASLLIALCGPSNAKRNVAADLFVEDEDEVELEKSSSIQNVQAERTSSGGGETIVGMQDGIPEIQIEGADDEDITVKSQGCVSEAVLPLFRESL